MVVAMQLLQYLCNAIKLPSARHYRSSKFPDTSTPARSAACVTLGLCTVATVNALGKMVRRSIRATAEWRRWANIPKPLRALLQVPDWANVTVESTCRSTRSGRIELVDGSKCEFQTLDTARRCPETDGGPACDDVQVL